MNRLYKALRALRMIIRNPWKLNLVLDRNEEWEKYVNKKYGIDALPVTPVDTFISGPVTVDPVTFLDGGSTPVDLALLRQIASGIKSCRYFEIGTWRGESVANVASVAEICYTLNLDEKELSRFLDDRDFLASQGFFSKGVKNINHIRGNSSTFDFGSLGMKFDLVFIDGDHHYGSIVSDTRNVLEHLCHDSSVIVWHDYASNSELLRCETMAAILDACPRELHPYLFHVRNTNCAVLYRKEILSSVFKKYELPRHLFSLQMNIKPIE